MNSSTTEPADSIAAELSPCSLHSPSMHFLPLNFSHCIASVHLSLIPPWQGYWGKELRDSLHMQPQRRAVTCNSFQVINQYWVSPSLYSHKKKIIIICTEKYTFSIDFVAVFCFYLLGFNTYKQFFILLQWVQIFRPAWYNESSLWRQTTK